MIVIMAMFVKNNWGMNNQNAVSEQKNLCISSPDSMKRQQALAQLILLKNKAINQIQPIVLIQKQARKISFSLKLVDRFSAC